MDEGGIESNQLNNKQTIQMQMIDLISGGTSSKEEDAVGSNDNQSDNDNIDE